ncbi:uncharacterized protein LOC114755092 isoform X2 [Neltuma alba]|uniref:uncharacterized protein LOC114755092 isoform X2 n=1 Tax=Neltuma alba TaxID=207710 RepID=UPI0010A4A5EC|nr:uncharacterized protein LOC114755092 isoform X2 [Prosopis alba]
MGFHVACPITCRRICYCSLGFPRSLHTVAAKNGFLDDVVCLREFLKDPSGLGVSSDSSLTLQVAVPKVLQLPPPPGQLKSSVVGDAVNEAASMQAKRVAMQRKGAAAMIAAEEYARRFESGDVLAKSGKTTGEECSESDVKVFCRMCNCVENEGSDREKKMLPCKSCGKKYHINCLRVWAQHRDLFHWTSWTCPACLICEACRRTGDPSKFMFCKRTLVRGPICAQNMQGVTVVDPMCQEMDQVWFLGYTCCDACGRLFMKGNYCPVCLKVYRDSELTPMVCCDICQRWVHCYCDGISDEKYHQFQVDGNLQYRCPACRGECYEVKNIKDAIQELWKRKDVADRDLIASLRVQAGLPTQEETFSISPYSDDENGGPVKRNEVGNLNSSPAAGCPVSQSGILKGKFIEEVSFSDKEQKTRGFQIRNTKAHGVDRVEETGENDKRTQTVQGKKLIVNLGPQKVNMTSSPQSDAISCQKDQDMVAPSGSRVDTRQSKVLKVFRRERNLRGNISGESEAVPLEQPRILLEKRSSEGIADQVGNGAAMSGGERTSLGRPPEGRFGSNDESDDNEYQTPSHSLPKDSKPLLRIKFKKPGIENQNLSYWEGMSVIKGQRSKRKRPSPLTNKASLHYEDVTHSNQNTQMDEIMDANWILMKLGKDAIGKRVEVHQTSDNSWNKGAVTGIIKGTSKLSVALDDGTVKMLDLNKQAVRFVPQKHKSSKA